MVHINFPKIYSNNYFTFIKNLPVPLYGKGKNIREWIHVKDCYAALEKIMKKELTEIVTTLVQERDYQIKN